MTNFVSETHQICKLHNLVQALRLVQTGTLQTFLLLTELDLFISVVY